MPNIDVKLTYGMFGSEVVKHHHDKYTMVRYHIPMQLGI